MCVSAEDVLGGWTVGQKGSHDSEHTQASLTKETESDLQAYGLILDQPVVTQPKGRRNRKQQSKAFMWSEKAVADIGKATSFALYHMKETDPVILMGDLIRLKFKRHLV